MQFLERRKINNRPWFDVWAMQAKKKEVCVGDKNPTLI